MREKFNHLYLDSHERKLLMHSLVELKNQLIQQGRYTDCVDELVFKVINAPTKRMKIEYSIAMSVVAKMKQYGVFRAIGLSNRQLAKMIIAEASTYAITGTICGSVLGIVCNKILFSKLITYKWGDAWSVPLVQLGIIIVVVAIAVILAVRNPIKKLEKTSIVDIISVQ